MLTNLGRTTGAEVELGLVLVVPSAAQRNVVDRRQSPEGVRDAVVELQERPLFAAIPVSSDEGAPATITAPHGTLDVARDSARRSAARGLIRPGADRTIALRPGRRRELRVFDLLEEQGQGAFDDDARIAAPDESGSRISGKRREARAA